MNVQHIIINDSNPEHRELSIYRTGKINRVKLQDKTYTTYHSLEMDGHDYAAFFHYGIAEALNKLPFLSESNMDLTAGTRHFFITATFHQ